MITVDASDVLGEASQCRDFLGAGIRADPPDHSFIPLVTNPDDPANIAWRKLKLKHMPFDDQRLYKIKRVTQESIEVDFTEYDRLVNGVTHILKAEPFVNLVFVPRELSSAPDDPNYNWFMPRDLRQWELFVRAVVRHNVKDLGLEGLFYDALGEPGWAGELWPGAYCAAYSYGEAQEMEARLGNTVNLYATTYRAVKSEDPGARVCAPGTASHGDIADDTIPPGIFDMGQWLNALREYNEGLPRGQRVGIDCVGWQQYGWGGPDSLSDAADLVSGHLSKYGFDPNIPKCTVGGGGCGSWSWSGANLTPAQRASYLLSNIITEFKDPSERRFASALYYFFNDKEQWGSWLGEGAVSQYMVYERKDGTAEYSTSYAAFQVLSLLADQEHIVRTSTEGGLGTMSVRAGERRVIAVVNNHSASAQRAEVVFENLPFKTNRINGTIQQINDEHSNGGKGLEAGASSTVEASEGRARAQLELPAYSTSVLTLTPMAPADWPGKH